MKLGIFDSGIGGKAVADELQRLLPDATIIMANDSANVPYGGRPKNEIIDLTRRAIKPLLDAACDVIVIACNTATTNAIAALREELPLQKFIGLEPMVKPAAISTKTKKIAVFATPATLSSGRYAELKSEWAQGVEIIEPDCSNWAELIENGLIESIPLSDTVNAVVDEGADVIVLACTHYHWLKEKVEEIAGPGVIVLEPSNAIKNRIAELLQIQSESNTN